MNEFSVTSSPLSGTNLIEASAGTGKTYAISLIFLRLIVENNFRIEDILVVTFTIPATMELRLRIRDRLRDAISAVDGREISDGTVMDLMSGYKNNSVMKQRISAALKSFDQASVYTIHSFCQQMLVDNAFESGSLFSSEIVNDDTLIDRGVKDLCRLILYKSGPALVSYFMDNCSTGELLALYKKRPLSPDLRIEPEDSGADIETLDICYNAVCELYYELSDIWRAESDNVSRIFRESEALKRNIYKEDSMDSLIEQMDQYISGENPFAFFDKFMNYTADKIANSLKKGCEPPESEVFNICQKLNTAYEKYNAAGESLLISIKKRLFDVIDELVLNSKNRNSRRTFDDLIRDAYRGLGGKAGKFLEDKVRARYRAALIDEFQDTDSLQFEIFNRLFNNDRTILFLIGDPKQAIYRFRGADIFSYMKASELVQNRYTLARNWRSRAELIESVNEVFGRSSNPFIFERIRFYPVSPGEVSQGDILTVNGKPLPAFDIWLADDEDESPEVMLLEKLASEISLLINRDEDNPYRLGDRGITPGDIAVLVRTRKQGISVRDSLARYSIPSVSRGMDNVFNTDEARSLYYIVSAISDPSNYRLVKSAVSTPVMGGTAGMLFSINSSADDGKEKLDGITSRFYVYRDTWATGGFLKMITGFLEKESVPARLFALKGGDRMVTNVNHIAEILHSAEHQNGFTPMELVAWFGNTLASPPDIDEYSMRLERDDNAVNIITMHACKGLEFPVVYSPFLSHSGDNRDNYLIFHDPSDNNRTVMYLDKNIPDDIKKIRDDEDLAENVRLLYVALTRAKSSCRVMLAPNRNFSRSAAFYILVKSSGYESLKYTRGVLVSSINALVENSGGRISFSQGGVPAGKMYIAEKHSADEMGSRKFTGTVKEGWKTHSYSAIALHSSAPVKPEEKDFQSEYHVKAVYGDGISAFPSGAKAGLCIHEIFEKTDFTLKDRDRVRGICREILEKYRFDVSSDEILTDMFFDVVSSVIDGSSGLRLSGIDESSRLSELEFNFPVKYFDSGVFREIFSGPSPYCDRIYQRLAGNHSEPGGMMKGFIDLVFVHNGKYYIADWKSNHLGVTHADYSGERILEEMEKHNYFLQYYLYTVALDRYLEQRLGGSYSYEEHFGGVYYFFIRGMNPVTAGNCGIFRDRPDRTVVERLDRYFQGAQK